MKSRKIDSSGDFTWGKGINNYVFNSNAVKQNIKTRLQSWANDCFFAMEDGVDYNLYLQTGEADLLEEDIRRVLVQTEGVAELTEFNFSLVDRVFRANYTIIDIYSQTFQDAIDLGGFSNA